jgi:hypothetical protein
MDPTRFDAFTKRLGTRLSRRNMLRGSAGLAAGALSIGALRSAAAQDEGTTAKDRFISVRVYQYDGTIEDAQTGLHDLIRTMEANPGFIEYNLVDTGNGRILAISTFLDQSSAVAAAEQEDAWIEANASDILPGRPEILSGDVFLRSELHAGCGCQTGTEDACNSERLVCCPTTDRMGGPGICLTAQTTCPEALPPEPEPTVAPATPTPDPDCTGEGCDCITGTDGACDDGLVCCSLADTPGGAGVCRTEDACGCTGEGCHCEGGVEGTCDDGLVCCPDDPGTPGGAGTCQTEENCEPASCTGEGCDCTTGTDGACDDGLVCCSTTDTPGGPGVCRTEDACGCTGEGCHCEGGVQGACDDGLVCCPDDPGTPGGAGTCQTEENCEPASCTGEGCPCQGGVQGACDIDLICCQDQPGVPGGSGTCQTQDNCAPPPCTGEGCDCTTGTDGACDNGLICCAPTTDPGSPGTCRTEDACDCQGPGCHCNTGVQDACAPGLTCCPGQEGVPGGPGICQETC